MIATLKLKFIRARARYRALWLPNALVLNGKSYRLSKLGHLALHGETLTYRLTWGMANALAWPLHKLSVWDAHRTERKLKEAGR